mgnify:CR=1 FL=1
MFSSRYTSVSPRSSRHPIGGSSAEARPAREATTTNGVNTFATGTISLADNDSNGLLFSPAAMNPGDTLARCIRVRYTGSITTSNVRLYTTGESATNSLDQYITIKIEQGTDATGGGPAFGNCTNFTPAVTLFNTASLQNLSLNKYDFATGLDTWQPVANNETRDYRFTYTFSSSAPNSVMASTAQVTFTWESQV